MGLNEAVQERLEEMKITDPLTKQMHIKMSGCPNGCSQHHIANIGFYGASMKVGDKTIPAYIAHIGGNYEGGEVVYGHRLKARIPAKRVPEAVERWVRFYEDEAHEGETFNDFVERVGADDFEEKVKDLAMPVDFSLTTMSSSSTGTATSRTRSSAAKGSARYSRTALSTLSRRPRLHEAPHRRRLRSGGRSPTTSKTPPPRRPCAGRSTPSTRSSTSPARSRRPTR